MLLSIHRLCNKILKVAMADPAGQLPYKAFLREHLMAST